MKRLLLTLACLTLGPSVGTATPLAIQAQAPLTLKEVMCHDPFIVADPATKTYHLYTRNVPAMTGEAREGTMAYTSRDLIHWSRPRVVFTIPAGIWSKDGGWAPEVHRWRGKWYLFTTIHNEAMKLPASGKRAPYRRGTILAVADSLNGPFKAVRNGEPIAPKSLMTLDGTLYVEGGKPWLVYAHEWLQATDGTMEAIPLDANLAAAGKPRLLFKASEGDWVKGQPQAASGDVVWVTDGPEFYRTGTGKLLMLWASYGTDRYNQGLARSKSGTIAGPWEQLGVLIGGDTGHGMLFKTFDGKLLLVAHRPFDHLLSRAKIYEMRDTGDRLEVVRQRIDLDGDGPEAARFIR